jgi:hypothetical protein
MWGPGRWCSDQAERSRANAKAGAGLTVAVCQLCGRTFKAKRADARLCSARCRKAASRSPGACQDGHVTDNATDGASAPVTLAVEPAARETEAACNVIELGRLPGDTIGDRRWRIAVEAGSFTLQCEAMVPGGWMSVTREPTLAALRRFAAWCGLTIGPVEVAAQPAQQRQDLEAVAA